MQIISFKFSWLLIKTLDIIEKTQNNYGGIPTKLLISQRLNAQRTELVSELMLRHIPFIHLFNLRVI